ncbi:thioredoxin family protein [Humibacter soli]
MNPLIAAAVVASLVLVTTIVGIVWRARTGRVRNASGPVVSAASLHTDVPLGRNATIVQFSTEFCGPCRIAERVLTGVAAERDGVAYLEVDLTAHPEAATQFGVMQTPTILLLNAAGGIRSRIGGVPRADDVSAMLDDIAREETHVGI